jgi:multidrug efflux pump subunit AcrA (membrane-fusion protein)
MTKTRVFRLALALAFAAPLATGCGGPAQSAGPEASGGAPLPVSVQRAAVADVPSVFEAGGIVQARHAAGIASRVLAPVSSVRVRPGDRVRAGQTLVELDGRQLDADRRRAAAALAAAENGARAAEADVRAADASFALARATQERIASLFERRSATPQEHDETKAALGAAEARLTGARARAAGAAAAVEAARAASDAASVAASYAVIAAPYDGVVSERQADPGDMAVPGQPLLTLEDTRGLEFEVRLDEARASAVAPGQVVSIRFDAAPAGEAAVQGHVVEIGRVDPASHSFIVRLDLPARPPLRSGTFGRAAFAGPGHRALIVPSAAVVRRGQLLFVFTVDGDRARLRPISIGQEHPDGIEVTAGLAEGELVVTNPAASLVDGAPVMSSSAGAAR